MTMTSAADEQLLIAAADADAAAAASASGMRIAVLDRIEDHRAVRALIEEVWRTGETNPPVTADMLSAMRTAEGYVSGAFDEHGLAGACLGFFGPPAQRRLHSHIAGALPRARGSGVGFALKLHQRAWALRNGARTITWTFDPLIRRNAHFNLGKLGARVMSYRVDLYGTMDDDINRDDITDRLLVGWRLLDPSVIEACAGRPDARTIADSAGTDAAVLEAITAFPDATVAVRAGRDGYPVMDGIDTETVLVQIPDDIEALRANDQAMAAAWRLAIRETLGRLLQEGATIRGFHRSGWYIIDRAERP